MRPANSARRGPAFGGGPKVAKTLRRKVPFAAAFIAVAGSALVLSGLAAAPPPNARAVRNTSNANFAHIKLDKRVIGKLPITELTEDQAIVHALNRLGYGPTPGEVEHVKKIGLETWIDQQLHPETLDDSALDARLAKYPTLDMSSRQLLDQFPPPKLAAKRAGETLQQYKQQMAEKRHPATAQSANEPMAPSMNGADNKMNRADQMLARIQGPNRIVAELSMAKIERAVYSQRQLEAVMEDFWFNHFNVFAAKGADRWLLTSYVRDTIRPNTMGKFQDLLRATAQSPAMLFYLDNWLSVDSTAFEQHQQQTAARRARLQSTFPGLFPRTPQAMADGADDRSQSRQASARRKLRELGINENYGREVMELHTIGVDSGYTQQDVIEMAKCLSGWTIRAPRRDPEFIFRPAFHAQGPKVVMGRTIDAGGERDGIESLQMLANDPHTARRISLELARHFVSDDPPPALVDRMTKEYEATGGDIRGLLRTMIYSPEFWSRQAYRAKVKTPFELVASTARALNADVSVALPLVQWTARMGEPLFLCQPPNGYPDKADRWVNSGALLNRLNFAMAVATNHAPGTAVDLSGVFGEQAPANPDASLDRALQVFLDGQINSQTRQTLEARLHDPQIVQARLDDPTAHVNEGLLAGLVLGTPEFQQR
ncbi:MAG: DUF1800 domain-containing protein [Candidatus Acidiferrales bacterium]